MKRENKFKQLLLSLLLILGGLSLTVSCDKVKDSLPVEEDEPIEEIEDIDGEGEEIVDNEPEVEEEKSGQLSKAAIARRDELMAEMKQNAKPFDRENHLKRMVSENHDIDLDELFPDGYSINKFKSQSAVEIALKKAVEQEALKEYNDEKKADALKQAEKIYPYIRIGDKVSVKTRKGDTVNGRVTQVDGAGDYIYVEQYKVLINDMKSPDPSLFYETKVIKKRQQYMLKNFEHPYEDYKEKLMNEMRKDVYRNHGYIEKSGKWVSLKVIILKEIEPKLDILERKYNEHQLQSMQNAVIEKLIEEGLLKQ